MRHAIVIACALIGAGACQAKMDWAAFWPLGAATADVAAVEAELLAADRAFNALAQAEGTGVAFGTYMAETDSRVFLPGGRIVEGAAAIGAAYDPGDTEDRLVWDPRDAEAARSGDFGYTWGVWRYYDSADPEAAPAASGKYVTIWRKNEHGDWRAAVDLGVSDTETDASPLFD